MVLESSSALWASAWSTHGLGEWTAWWEGPSQPGRPRRWGRQRRHLQAGHSAHPALLKDVARLHPCDRLLGTFRF